MVNQVSHLAIERNSTDIKKQNSTLDGNPAITVSATFAYDQPVYQPSSLEKELAELQGKTLTVEKDIDDIEVYKRVQIITIKDSVGYIVSYTAPKLEFDNYIGDVNKMIETLRIILYHIVIPLKKIQHVNLKIKKFINI